MNQEAITKKAYKSWKDQGQRRGNTKDPRYYCYGSRGIRRIYSSIDFVAWYLAEYSKKENWICCQVDRIESSKNYGFDNIRLLERSDNVKLRNIEHGNPTPNKKVIAKNLETGETIVIESIREASRVLTASRATIMGQLNGTTRKPRKYMSSYDT